MKKKSNLFTYEEFGLSTRGGSFYYYTGVKLNYNLGELKKGEEFSIAEHGYDNCGIGKLFLYSNQVEYVFDTVSESEYHKHKVIDKDWNVLGIWRID